MVGLAGMSERVRQGSLWMNKNMISPLDVSGILLMRCSLRLREHPNIA